MSSSVHQPEITPAFENRSKKKNYLHTQQKKIIIKKNTGIFTTLKQFLKFSIYLILLKIFIDS